VPSDASCKNRQASPTPISTSANPRIFLRSKVAVRAEAQNIDPWVEWKPGPLRRSRCSR
jgi:hypothetical protein